MLPATARKHKLYRKEGTTPSMEAEESVRVLTGEFQASTLVGGESHLFQTNNLVSWTS